MEGRCNINTGDYNYQPNPQMVLYCQKTQVDIQKEMQLSNIRIGESLTKTYYAEQRRTEEYERRLKLREEAKERQRAIVEILDVDEEGQLLVCSKNTSIDARPRRISNMRQPSITVLQCTNSTECLCYMLECLVGREKKYIFLSSDKLGKGNYVVEKLTSAGVYFEIKPSQIKPLVLNLIGRLVQNSSSKKQIPETDGWIKLNNEYIFFSKEDLTWAKIKLLMK